ncbi:class I SAM-dependent methyltransferase [Pyxidicoccus xibeiensis]|uniref:class I SAM-dependent methyltransferase n=1 Tax=Pyxidicoccus xibeiensis TaxID=2906759 RepID=UPI0020A76BB8|nr:class I SAM-dependent methyltransferase [Pyxidicoccus xibeiensis]MCP3145263.1 class I SAM-dependent methyltransferase [Pyxidicoccus xibeiensis]
MDAPSSSRPDSQREPLLSELREVIAYYDSLAPTYDAARFGNSYGAYLDGLERPVLRGWLRGERVLDLGCGTGRFLDLASEGLDFSPKMVQLARERWPGKPIHEAPAWSIPAPDGAFDSIFSLHVFMHLPAHVIQLVLDECWRVLRMGGVMVFDFPVALRRKLVGHQPPGWHAATTLSEAELHHLCETRWRLAERRGLALAPVHRLPQPLRPPLMVAERLLGRTPLKHLASYQLVKLEKLD